VDEKTQVFVKTFMDEHTETIPEQGGGLQKKNSTLWEHHATVGFPLVCTYGLYVSV
jgi:hypothetical protein